MPSNLLLSTISIPISVCLSVHPKETLENARNRILIYSRLPNNRRVWNNRIGWMFPIKLMNVGYGIVVLGGNFQ